ncbi:U7 snRNA-associated Sm-like protein LSm10 [Galendromus occidentalis]|uniref:U7 snRNA-associated Sm-like protein LSm10 n=1 Tax=Galendromus occidentalis TaxID=34638 RepID=A0AAJ6VU07_9ACAR|nr:U7 snRNA-associated Sm-like protein LSm10 [Galendromus occidentalis]
MSSFLQSSRDKAVAVRSLLCLVQALEGRETTVDLRNETEVVGTIEVVDGRMNIQMSDAVVTMPNGSSRQFSFLHVRGRNVRYVHIPPDVNIMKTIEDRVQRVQGVIPAAQAPNDLAVMITRRKREQLRRRRLAEGR